MSLVSVIIPIHNLEKYLEKCIESVINQTYQDLEIILVNDGSTDRSLEICESYQERDNRIQVIDKKCGGVSDARNGGLRAATGEYIFLLDGDDYILSNTIEVLYNGVISHDAELAVCNYFVVSEESEIEKNVCDGEMNWKVLNRDQAFAKLVSGKPFYSLPWNKLYKHTIFDTFKYPLGKINEDEFAAHQIYGRIHRAVFTDQKLYAYVQHGKSIMANYSMRRHHKAEALRERVLYLRNEGCPQPIIREAIFRYLIEELNFRYNIRKVDQSVEDKKQMKVYFADAKRTYLKYFSQLSFVQHIKIFTIYLFPSFYRFARKRGA